MDAALSGDYLGAAGGVVERVRLIEMWSRGLFDVRATHRSAVAHVQKMIVAAATAHGSERADLVVGPRKGG